MGSLTHEIKDQPCIPAKPWKKATMPKRVLAIRLQAMGDLVITLPYLRQLKKMMPEGTTLDLLTREEVDMIPRNIQLFDKVYSIGGGRNEKKQLIYTGLILPGLLLRRYDVVIDLQHNRISRLVRQMLYPAAWSTFDRFTPIAAGESNRLTVEAIGLGNCNADCSRFSFQNKVDVDSLLNNNGWDGTSNLVVLNPAGAFITRNWPVENYVEFAGLWAERFPDTQFLVIGQKLVESKAQYFQGKLDGKLINLVNKTSQVEAFALIQRAGFVLSEDSGLMHMAWVSGVPTLAMFGSTNSNRARPLGNHSLLLHSSDLVCGNCMQETCTYGDTRCLSRYTAPYVFNKAVSLINK